MSICSNVSTATPTSFSTTSIESSTTSTGTPANSTSSTKRTFKPTKTHPSPKQPSKKPSSTAVSSPAVSTIVPSSPVLLDLSTPWVPSSLLNVLSISSVHTEQGSQSSRNWLQMIKFTWNNSQGQRL